MSQEIEIELKNLLTKDEYHRLLKAYTTEQSKIEKQVNHYFETPNFDLKKNGAALRIRLKNQKYTVTLKQPHTDGLLETHADINEDIFKKWINNQPTRVPEIEQALSKLSIDYQDLEYGGSLTTERMETEENDTLIVIDKSDYNGITDYELEIEASSRQDAEKKMKQLLSDYAITNKETPNKIKRFYDTMVK
ncbi:Uncharacterized protein YjbK [Pelagirhabdus alkalitolerans]|uniref:Uncharacterized protein YjbK n=1 Tax=Pelagirhabdus alkalitolerans TaxID=1612202 RepID=A0A1G6KDU3_9BACI|nr:CYTH domain-containing protein [Pelagirhabdus alkalitolerans]SDC29114.1 Uncharacterized protein YjbK [Pelagirhabdus alkalitolerans]